MKKFLLFLILVSIALFAVACTKTVETDGDPIEFAPTQQSGDIAAFSLVGPEDHEDVTTLPTFRWNAAENADSYILEICTSTEFTLRTQEGKEMIKQIYLKKTGLKNNEFDLIASLKKNIKYYWRVTAVNSNRKQTSDEVFSFTYKAVEVDEVAVPIGYANQWKVHEAGSKATVTRDQNDFFRKGGDDPTVKDSLRVSFDREDTQRGEDFVSYNGWVVVSRELGMEFYGIDAFFFNFYYAGNDAKAYFRVVDEDNDYWYAEIKISKNARQSVIIPLEDFVHRTEGVTIGDGEFDYQYLKTVELVFEKVDGDGVAYFGGLSGVKYEKFKNMFIDEMNFAEYKDKRTFENYNFGMTETAESATLSFSGQANELNDKGMQGYGIVHYQIGKMIVSGDAFEFTLGFTDLDQIRNANFMFRVVEEDGDRWIYSSKISDLPDNGKILLPFTAFTLHEYKGDGLRQFGYIKEFQFGINENNAAGSITISDFKIRALSKVFGDDLYTVNVADDGTIDNFESYDPGYQVLYKWEPSAVNKDEAIEVYSESALGAKNHAAKMGYKTDLEAASYRVNFAAVKGYNAISIDAKDLSSSSARATMIVYLHTANDELYSYTITRLANSWKTYVIPISAFAIDAKSSGRSAVTIDRITGVSVAFQYFYVVPNYYSGNYVCVDNVRFVNAADLSDKHSVSDVEVPGKVKKTSTNKALIDDFDSLTNNTLLWKTENTNEFAVLELVDGEGKTASGSGKSLSMPYKTKPSDPEVVSYFKDLVVDGGVKAKGVTILMKGDGLNSKAKVILYVTKGNTTYKYVATIDSVTAEWTKYNIGFNAFVQTEGDSLALKDNVSAISRISINYQNYSADRQISKILIDEIYFDNAIQLTDNSASAYAA